MSSKTVTTLLPPTSAAIHQAAETLREGGLVAMPTETVYGLAAAAENDVAVQAMFAAKGRPADHPVIVHLAEARQLDEFAALVPESARQLAAAFWPGPLTLVVRRNARISPLVTGGLPTVGLRVPAHPVAQALLRAFRGPLAAPSANRFGRVSPTTAQHVLGDLAGRVDLILDGGPCEVGLESTIVDCSGDAGSVVNVLRPGAITAEQIAQVLHSPVIGAAAASPRVSGSLPSHYAPRARVEIVPEAELFARAAALAAQGEKVALLSRQLPPTSTNNVILLMIPADERQWARNLYSLLRQVDERGCNAAVAALPTGEGLSAAIADRLRRAAGRRDV